jgi:hypothetical protein
VIKPVGIEAGIGPNPRRLTFGRLTVWPIIAVRSAVSATSASMTGG